MQFLVISGASIFGTFEDIPASIIIQRHKAPHRWS